MNTHNGLTGIAALLVLVMTLAACTKDDPRKETILGHDRMDVRAGERQGEALAQMAQEGVTGATYVHVAAYSGFERATPETLRLVRSAISAGRWGEIGAGLVSSGEFLSVAASLGMVREVYWLHPYEAYEDIVYAEGSVREFLKKREPGLDPREVDLMRWEGGCLRGQAAGVMLHVCGSGFVPVIKGPAVVGIDPGYFDHAAHELRLTKLGTMKLLLDLLTLREIETSAVYVSYGVTEGHVRPLHRYLGDEVVEALENPAILAEEIPPVLWSVRDQAEDMLYAGMTGEALEFLVAQEQNFPGDRALVLMHAAALVHASRYDEALALAQGVCDAHAPSCTALPYLGYLAVEAGDTAHAEMFARAAEGRLPEGFVRPDQSDYAALDRAERERVRPSAEPGEGGAGRE